VSVFATSYIELVWTRELSLTSHSVIMKFGYLQKQRYCRLKLFAKIGLRKFRHGKAIVFSTKLVDGQACPITPTTVDASWLAAYSLLNVGRE